MAEEFEAIAELSAAAAAELAASAVANRGGPTTECNNCGTPLIGPYCAACGQPHETYRKSIFRLIGDTIAHVVNFDSRLMQTMIALLLEPGELPRAFKAGQTQRYVPAPRLYLFVSLLFFVFLSLTSIALMQLEIDISPQAQVSIPSTGFGFEIGPKVKTAEYIELQKKEISGSLTAADIMRLQSYETGSQVLPHFFSRLGTVQSRIPDEVRDQLAKMQADNAKKPRTTGNWLSNKMLQGLSDLAKNPAAINGPLTAWIPRVLFLLLPLFAGLMWLFYWRQRKQFLLIDHLVFSLTLHTFAFVVLIFAALAVQVAPVGFVGWAALILILSYFFFSMKWFYNQNYFWTTAKFMVVGFIYTFLFLLPSLALVIFASLVQA